MTPKFTWAAAGAAKRKRTNGAVASAMALKPCKAGGDACQAWCTLPSAHALSLCCMGVPKATGVASLQVAELHQVQCEAAGHTKTPHFSNEGQVTCRSCKGVYRALSM